MVYRYKVYIMKTKNKGKMRMSSNSDFQIRQVKMWLCQGSGFIINLTYSDWSASIDTFLSF